MGYIKFIVASVVALPTIAHGADLQLKASSPHAQSPNVAANVVDGKSNTRFSDDSIPAVINLDAGSAQNLKELKIQFYKGKERMTEFAIEVSVDGIRYQTLVGRKASEKAESQIIQINQLARFVRVLGYGNSGDIANRAFTSINEISVSAASSAVVIAPEPLKYADGCAIGKNCWVDVRKVRPTQFALGYAEVEERAEKYRDYSSSKLASKLKEKIAPAIRGPRGEIYITDHHHLAQALIEIGKPYFWVNISEDWSGKSDTEFQAFLIAQSKVYLYDENDSLRNISELPLNISDLNDDPFRSLVYFAEDEGCIKETGALYEQFQWAHYLRGYIAKSLIESDMDSAVEKACQAVKGQTLKSVSAIGW